MQQPRAPRQFLWIWILCIAAFYAAWTSLVLTQGRWPEVKAHWPIMIAMALGSYVAGSTPLGGGTVAFPVLVLVMGMPATLGRDFSFAIQATGMTSAAIFVLARRQTLAWPMLKGVLLGSTLGVPIGILWLAPLVSELLVKIIFAVVWCSFGILHLRRLREIAALQGRADTKPARDFWIGAAVGFFSGATVTSVTGVGTEMLVYTTLVLLCRADLKIAIPTAVASMAYTALIAVAVKNLSTGLQPGAFENWLAAAPIVILGAPLGAFIVSKIGRQPTLYVVAILCVAQFIWTCYSARAALGPTGLILAAAAVALALIALERLRARGLKPRPIHPIL